MRPLFCSSRIYQLSIDGKAPATAWDPIFVATGTYTDSGEEVVLLDKDATPSGGWDEAFTMQSGISIIDGEGSRRGISVIGMTVAIE